MTRSLGEDWLATARAVGARDDLAGAGAALLSRWAEPHRSYHGVAHLTDVLDRVDELAAEAEHVEVVALGAWFHDAVYDPSAADNEARSAGVAREVLGGLRVEARVVDAVVRLVEMTRDHLPVDGDRNGAVLSDADLAVLGSRDYERYAGAVRREYAHLDDAAFTAGRAVVLRSLLERPAIFHTPSGRTAWEELARANLRLELARLGVRSPAG